MLFQFLGLVQFLNKFSNKMIHFTLKYHYNSLVFPLMGIIIIKIDNHAYFYFFLKCKYWMYKI